jgi:hypothetical protein
MCLLCVAGYTAKCDLCAVPTRLFTCVFRSHGWVGCVMYPNLLQVWFKQSQNKTFTYIYKHPYPFASPKLHKHIHQAQILKLCTECKIFADCSDIISYNWTWNAELEENFASVSIACPFQICFEHFRCVKFWDTRKWYSNSNSSLPVPVQTFEYPGLSQRLKGIY